MTTEPADHPTSASPSAPRQAAWPWLLLPLIALTLYYVLTTVKHSPAENPTHHAEAPADSTPGDDTASR